MRHLELIKAKDYYGKHATGYLILVDGHPTHHMPLSELKETDLYKEWLEYFA